MTGCPLTPRERAVLDAPLSVEPDGAAELRAQARHAVVSETCDCGCPSVDFAHPADTRGMRVRVNAAVNGSDDGLFLYTVGPWLGGIEYVGVSAQDPDVFPEPDLLTITPVY